MYQLEDATITVLETGSYNVHFKVEHEGAIYDLRKSNRPNHVGNLAYEAEVLTHLEDSSFDLSPQVEPASSGMTNLWIDNAGWTLFRWMGDGAPSGQPYVNTSRIRNAAFVLADIHRLGQYFFPRAARGDWPIFTLPNVEPQKWLGRAMRLAGRLVSQQMHQLRGGALPRPKPEFEVSDVSTGVILEGDGFRVTSQRIEHVDPQLQANAYRLDTDDISIVFTGDARPCDHLIDLASDADVLVSMCGNFQSELERKGVHSGQIGSLIAAEMAAEAGVGQLVMVHMGPDISSFSGRVRAVEEMSSIFQGEIIVSDELSSYDLRRKDASKPTATDISKHTHIFRDM